MTTVVITGANRGLGLALAQHYTAAGAHVIGGCRNPVQAGDLQSTGAADASLDTVRAAKAMCDVAGHYSRPDLLRLVVNRSTARRLIEEEQV